MISLADQKNPRFLPKNLPDLFQITTRNDYAIDQVYVVSKSYISEIRTAAESAFHVYRKIFRFICGMSDEILLGLGIHESLFKCIKISYEGVEDSVVGRFDFIVTPEGPKVIEFNAETPYFSIESHKISGQMATRLGFIDPNFGAENALRNALVEAVKKINYGGRVVIAGHSNVEDDITARYAAEIMHDALGAQVGFSGVKELYLKADGLYDVEGKIDILYTFYPLELFAMDPGGPNLFTLLAEDKLRLINPPSSNLLQNKGTVKK
jgi:glutathionylspermidine synthase